jgi:hypothetical protein
MLLPGEEDTTQLPGPKMTRRESTISAGPGGGPTVSAKHFQLLVVKALWEEDFRDLLFSRPEEAMEQFDLTNEERAELQRMERERFADLVVEFRLRVTKTVLGLGSEVAFDPQPDPPARISLDSLFRLRAYRK